MTCQNCVRHVTQALEGLPGVRSVNVDLATGAATLQVAQPLDLGVISAALDDAGYQLAE
ncbi:MAG: heavy-metal-associated domain-containing protein [bacterium]|nr:heavy-metal-associated domain-containing protein [bacterium]